MPKSGIGSLKRTKHAVYDTKFHLVWIPKYGKNIFNSKIREYIKEVFQEITEEFEFEIDTMEVMKDHVHLFLSAPPRYSPARIVQTMKVISAKQAFTRFLHLRSILWSREIWSDGYFVQTIGDKVTAQVIKRYIQYQQRAV